MMIDMVTWNEFIWFALPTMLTAAVAAVVSLCANDHWAASSLRYRRFRRTAISLYMVSVMLLGAFIAGLWLSLQRPPLRTMGETRLWYSFFALIAGLFTYVRWRYRWVLSFSTVLSSVFMIINLTRPEIHDQTLVPALQSAWFIPHVTVYMFSYSFMGCAFILALVGFFRPKADVLGATDTLIYIGTAFLTFGMLSGAMWAKEAWGHYWSWDPKETWALATWLFYLLYIHLRLVSRPSKGLLYIIIILAFACLQMCWWGINYLPAAQDSIHVY